MDFSALPGRAQRAAFAHMSSTPAPAKKPAKGGKKTLGSGARHKQLKAKQAKAAGVHDRLSPGHAKGQGATAKDVSILVARYRVMHGRDPSPQQIARIRKAK